MKAIVDFQQKYPMFVGAVLCVIIAVLLGYASHTGAYDKPYGVTDEVKGTYHMVTQHSIDACKGKPHYSTVNVDGVERRCVKIKGE